MHCTREATHDDGDGEVFCVVVGGGGGGEKKYARNTAKRNDVLKSRDVRKEPETGFPSLSHAKTHEHTFRCFLCILFTRPYDTRLTN